MNVDNRFSGGQRRGASRVRRLDSFPPPYYYLIDHLLPRLYYMYIYCEHVGIVFAMTVLC